MARALAQATSRPVAEGELADVPSARSSPLNTLIAFLDSALQKPVQEDNQEAHRELLSNTLQHLHEHVTEGEPIEMVSPRNDFHVETYRTAMWASQTQPVTPALFAEGNNSRLLASFSGQGERWLRDIVAILRALPKEAADFLQQAQDVVVKYIATTPSPLQQSMYTFGFDLQAWARNQSLVRCL